MLVLVSLGEVSLGLSKFVCKSNSTTTTIIKTLINVIPMGIVLIV